ncbi:hypothetical protein [uncultured Corynebacterium sp.]|uniref:hypothetical protein n=1 Tax=uncultured Corynebacterium sp. TaxID=159447 RepID=UPI0025F0793A|nr:hypothetical protein [uncultured Corynebacterium sp.]
MKSKQVADDFRRKVVLVPPSFTNPERLCQKGLHLRQRSLLLSGIAFLGKCSATSLHWANFNRNEKIPPEGRIFPDETETD